MTDKRTEQRDKLVRAAYDLVMEVGVAGLRTRDIARRAGVNIATLHYCFDGKDALLQALYEFILGKFRSLVDAKAFGEESATDKLRSHVALRLAALKEQPEALRAWRGFVGQAWIDPQVGAIVRRHTKESRQRLIELVRQARLEGALVEMPGDDRVCASMLLALFDGLIFQQTIDPDSFYAEDYGRELLSLIGVSARVERGMESVR
jgi:AcrR family transcriptional regulator